MARQILYAYVDGADLDGVAPQIESALAALVITATWASLSPRIVNQRHARDLSEHPDDLVAWDLGLNLDLPDSGSEPTGWFQDVEQVARIVARIAVRTGRDFVIGIGDNTTGITDDLCFVDGGEPNLARLRAALGVGS